MEDSRSRARDELARARAELARLTQENERLRRRLADERFAGDLQAALARAVAAGTIASPVAHDRLLTLIVETAAAVIGAPAGSLFLVDEQTEELTFEVALGPKAGEAKKLRVPLGHGIAGLVAVTGQPLAVANAGEDARQAADIARRVGYRPRSILCVPLFYEYEDRVIGVLELLDKNGGAPFTPADMATLGRFANLAAITIEQSRTARSLPALVAGLVGAGGDGASAGPSPEEASAFAAHAAAGVAYQEAQDLAALVQEIAWRGDRERAAGRALLVGFADYLRARPDSFDRTGGLA